MQVKQVKQYIMNILLRDTQGEVPLIQKVDEETVDTSFEWEEGLNREKNFLVMREGRPEQLCPGLRLSILRKD